MLAAKPSTWAIRGVALGPREADPAIRGATWAAWATGPHGERLQAHGGSPEEALLALTRAVPTRTDFENLTARGGPG